MKDLRDREGLACSRGEPGARAPSFEEILARALGTQPCGEPTDFRDDEFDRQTVDQSTASFDPDRLGVGSTYYRDATSSRIFIPPEPVLFTDSRYLAQLAVSVVEQGKSARVRGLRLAVGIGCVFTNDDAQNPYEYVLEINQTSPFWAFQDGNVCFGLRVVYGPEAFPPAAIPLPAGQSRSYATVTDSVLLVDGVIGAPGVPNAPAGGYFPGQPVGSLGLFRDLRFPWAGQSVMGTIDVEIEGPAMIGLYASIKQTDPTKRPLLSRLLPQNATSPALPPEEQFLLWLEQNSLPPAIYRHVSGSIIADQGQFRRRPGYRPVQGRSPT